MHRTVRQPALEFSGRSWPEVLRELADWLEMHQRSRDPVVSELVSEALSGAGWIAIDAIIVYVADDSTRYPDQRYSATLLYS